MPALGHADSLDLASFVLGKVGPAKHLKLQKLLYYIEAWHLAAFEQSLISDDFEAWLHGPVSRRVWDKYKAQYNLYGRIPVSAEDKERASIALEASLSREQFELIEDVLVEYGPKTAYYLECLTHSEEPWRAARIGVGEGEASSNKISKDLMQRFYRQRI